MVFELKLYPDGRTPSAMSFKLSEETKKQRKEKSTSPNLRENEKKKGQPARVIVKIFVVFYKSKSIPNLNLPVPRSCANPGC